VGFKGAADLFQSVANVLTCIIEGGRAKGEQEKGALPEEWRVKEQ
jgi:hypothetical protein